MTKSELASTVLGFTHDPPTECQPHSDPTVTKQRSSSSARSVEQPWNPLADIRTTDGETALRRAILEDALICFQKQTATAGRQVQRLAREAEAWFFADDYSWPFSFVNICAVLKLDPEYIRLGLKRWRERPPVKQKRHRRPAVANRSLRIAA